MKKLTTFFLALTVLGSISIPAYGIEPSCAEGGSCAVGDVGPGGGYVIYAAPKAKKWGQYIEIAPDGWFSGRPDPNVEPFCYQRPSPLQNLISTSTAIGSGFKNTNRLIKICKNGAAATARSYRGGGFKNWSLPSKDELNEAVFESFGVNTNFANETAWYWSSSVRSYGAISAYYAGLEDWDSTYASSNDGHVRPVRHFKKAR